MKDIAANKSKDFAVKIVSLYKTLCYLPSVICYLLFVTCYLL